MGKKNQANRSKLRAVVNQNETCAKLFREAEALAKSIFEGKQYVPLPFYTEHGEGHCEMLEDYLDQIIWRKGEEPSEHDFVPSPEEAMYLLSAIKLHDIGMWYGIFDNEHVEDLRDINEVINLRNTHEFRTSRYIIEKWKDSHKWPDDEKTWLSNICVFHRRAHPIISLDPHKINGRYTNVDVRFAVLAALLRLADACHVDKTRAPRPVMELYISLGMPQKAVCHWGKAELIREVNFDRIGRKITLTAYYPPKVDFDLGEVGEIVCGNVREELRSVEQTLSNYPNTSFTEVKHDAHYITALSFQQKRRCLALWPYLLSKPCSATEAATALSKMLLLAAEEGEDAGKLGVAWRRKMFQIMRKTKESHPVDFMIRNLCKEVRKILSSIPKQAKSCRELTGHLRSFMKAVENNCKKMAVHTLKVIDPGEALVIYGYSTNIEQLLTNLDKQHPLYIVDCYKPVSTPLGLDENKRIIECAQEHGFKEIRFLQLPSLAQALGELQWNKKPCKLLLGTHGVLKNGDLLCKVGSYTLAATAKKFDTRVIAFAEEMKSLKKGIPTQKIAGPEKLFTSKEYKLRPEMSNVMYVEPKMDLVPRSLVDIVVTEKGAKQVVVTDTRRFLGAPPA